eukprot:scaffold71900_cov57-Phaeocystis_antarctica.AAC.2
MGQGLEWSCSARAAAPARHTKSWRRRPRGAVERPRAQPRRSSSPPPRVSGEAEGERGRRERETGEGCRAATDQRAKVSPGPGWDQAGTQAGIQAGARPGGHLALEYREGRLRPRTLAHEHGVARAAAQLPRLERREDLLLLHPRPERAAVGAAHLAQRAQRLRREARRVHLVPLGTRQRALSVSLEAVERWRRVRAVWSEERRRARGWRQVAQGHHRARPRSCQGGHRGVAPSAAGSAGASAGADIEIFSRCSGLLGDVLRRCSVISARDGLANGVGVRELAGVGKRVGNRPWASSAGRAAADSKIWCAKSTPRVLPLRTRALIFLPTSERTRNCLRAACTPDR